MHEIGNGVRDLVVDFVVLGIDLRIDADVGDEQIGVRDAVGINVFRQHRAVLDREAVQAGAADKKRTDTGLDIGFEPAKEAVELLGGLHGLPAYRPVANRPIGESLKQLQANP